MISSGIIMLLFGIGFIALGIYIRKNPTAFWRMNESWKVQGDSEPSQAYIDSRTFSGAVFILVGGFFSVFSILLFIQPM